jgi:Tol biopolymer transport system component
MRYHLALSAIIISLAGCKSMSSFYSEVKNKTVEFFNPKQDDIFPKYIQDIFPKSKEFASNVTRSTETKQSFRLIEVKRLTKENTMKNESNLSWSSNGSYLSFETVDFKHRHIKVQALNGSFNKTLTMLPRGRGDFLRGMVSSQILSYNSGLSWSHDNYRYAFMSNGGIGIYNIYVGTIDGDEEIIANSPTKEGYASWSPVANELVFVSARSGSGDLYLLELGASKPIRLTSSKHPDLFPEWLPNGKGIVYASGSADLHRIELIEKNDNGWGKPRILTHWHKDDLRPKVSPCGQWVAFYSKKVAHSSQDAQWDLHVIKIKDAPFYSLHEEHTLLVKNVIVDLNTGPAWSPDGQKLLFVKKDPQRFNPIHMYDLAKGQESMIKTGTKMNRDILMSPLGVLSFRAQVGAWDKVFIALTNQGRQLQPQRPLRAVLINRQTTNHKTNIISPDKSKKFKKERI